MNIWHGAGVILHTDEKFLVHFIKKNSRHAWRDFHPGTKKPLQGATAIQTFEKRLLFAGLLAAGSSCFFAGCCFAQAGFLIGFFADESGQVAAIFGFAFESVAAVWIADCLKHFSFDAFLLFDIPELCFHFVLSFLHCFFSTHSTPGCTHTRLGQRSHAIIYGHHQ